MSKEFRFLKPPCQTFFNGTRVINSQEKAIVKEARKHGKSWEEIANYSSCDIEYLHKCIPLKYFVKTKD